MYKFHFPITRQKQKLNEIDIYKSCVHIINYTTSKQIELEGTGCSGFEADLGSFKTWASGTF